MMRSGAGGLAGTAAVCHFLVRQASPDTYVDFTDHYHPVGRIAGRDPLDRPITPEEYAAALAQARAAGLRRFASRSCVC